MKTDLQKLKDELNDLGLDVREYSILNDMKPDCFNLIESIGDGFIVFYMDDRGNKLYELELYSFKDAGDYMKELVKKLKY